MKKIPISSWLVQRFSPPKGYVNPFGVTDAPSQTELSDVIDFDYMGEAEYEHGAITECLSAMWEGIVSYRDVICNYPNYNKIYVVARQDDDNTRRGHHNYGFDEILEAIDDVYNKGEDHEKNSTIQNCSEVSKGDYGSFYRVCK